MRLVHEGLIVQNTSAMFLCRRYVFAKQIAKPIGKGLVSYSQQHPWMRTRIIEPVGTCTQTPCWPWPAVDGLGQLLVVDGLGQLLTLTVDGLGQLSTVIGLGQL